MAEAIFRGAPHSVSGSSLLVSAPMIDKLGYPCERKRHGQARRHSRALKKGDSL